MDTWEIFKKAYKEYYCGSEQSTIKNGSGINLYLSGINNYYLNYAFIDNYFNNKNNILNNINESMAIFSFPEKRKEISDSLTNKKFLGTGMIMTNNVYDFSYNPIISDNLRLIKVNENINYLTDYILILSKVKKCNRLELKKIFNKEYILSSNIQMYLAYLNNEPVGALAACIIDGCAFSVDSAIVEEQRNAKVLTSLGEFALQDGIEQKISKYSCLVTSPYTMKLVEKQGYKYDMPCDVWMYNCN